MHGLYGYREVIDTVAWGLRELGHTTGYGLNTIATDATNIVFGAQVLPLELQEQLPPDSIVYNLEQLRGLAEPRASIATALQRFRIWEYSAFNFEAWERWSPRYPVQLVPIGYAPILERIPRSTEQDIEVLLYGMSGQERLETFHALSHAGIASVFVSGLYGAGRDGLIARAKIVLNLNLYAHARIFEVVRVSYLLANRKAVVSDWHAEAAIEPD